MVRFIERVVSNPKEPYQCRVQVLNRRMAVATVEVWKIADKLCIIRPGASQERLKKIKPEKFPGFIHCYLNLSNLRKDLPYVFSLCILQAGLRPCKDTICLLTALMVGQPEIRFSLASFCFLLLLLVRVYGFVFAHFVVAFVLVHVRFLRMRNRFLVGRVGDVTFLVLVRILPRRLPLA